jgi:hypothetical protein
VILDNCCYHCLGISKYIYENFQDQFQTTARSKQTQAYSDLTQSEYSTFSSSNFFWENLEKTALTLGELAEVYLYKAPSFPEEAVSVSGSTFAYPYVYSDTSIRQDAPKSPGSNLISQNHYSGSTMQALM